MTVRWTPELDAAILALIDEPATHPHSNDADVRSRAREYRALEPGYELKPFQVEYTECLIQRLDLEWDNPRPSHTAFRTAWEKALGS